MHSSIVATAGHCGLSCSNVEVGALGGPRCAAELLGRCRHAGPLIGAPDQPGGNRVRDAVGDLLEHGLLEDTLGELRVLAMFLEQRVHQGHDPERRQRLL